MEKIKQFLCCREIDFLRFVLEQNKIIDFIERNCTDVASSQLSKP